MYGPKNIVLLPDGNKWAIKEEGTSKYLYVRDNKKEAETFGRDLAMDKEVDFIIYRRDGKVELTEKYSNNKHNPFGRVKSRFSI